MGLLGTEIALDVPLMSVGLDSISATEFTRLLGERLGISIPATLLFDHPTIASITDFVGSSLLPASSTETAILETPRLVKDDRSVLLREATRSTVARPPAICGTNFELPQGLTTSRSLGEVVCEGKVAASSTPIVRWAGSERSQD